MAKGGLSRPLFTSYNHTNYIDYKVKSYNNLQVTLNSVNKHGI